MDLNEILMTGMAVVLMLAILTVIIFVHELGHYTAARFFGFQTPVFGLGLPFFGPHWTLFRKWGTDFRLHALFIGGYVLIPELGDESQAVSETYDVEVKPFKKFPVWQRAIVAAAGVFNNFVFAYILMLGLFLTLGAPVTEVVVAFLPPDNPIAKNAGVKAGDRILAIDNSSMESTDQVVEYLSARKEKQVVLHVFRPDKVNLDTPAPKVNENKKDPQTESADHGTEKSSDTNASDSASAATPAKASEEPASNDSTANDSKSTDAKADDSTANESKSTADTKASDSSATDSRDSTPGDSKDTVIAHEPAEGDSKAMGPGRHLDITVTTNAMGKVGMGLGDKLTTRFQKVEGNIFEVSGKAGVRIVNSTVGMCKSLSMMVEGVAHNLSKKVTGLFKEKGEEPKKDSAPSVGVEDLHGLLYVLKIGADIAQQDWTMLPMFTILISLDLAIINLLPWPGLDGGHLAFMAVEAVRGKPMGENTQGQLVKWGLITLLVLMAVIMVNDIRSFITGDANFKVKSKQEERAK